jgi:hypothetical protein
MAEVTLLEKSSPCSSVILTLAEGSGPQLELALPTNHPWNLERGELIMQLLGERAEFSWAGQSLTFRVTGFRSTPGGRDAIVGLVLSDDTLDWFEQRRVASGTAGVLVYQRQAADPNGWAYLRRVLGNQFGIPHGADALDEALPIGTCLCRPATHDNLSHQRRILALMAHLPTRAWGWCGFDTEVGDPPLRVLGLDSPVLELREGWAPGDLGDVHLPHRVGGAAVSSDARPTLLVRPFLGLTHDKSAELVRELTRAGVEGAVDHILEDGSEIPCLPGQVKVGGMVCLCPVVRYSFDLRQVPEDGQLELRVQLTLAPLPIDPGQTPMSFSGTGLFVEWDENSEKRRVALKSPDERWLLMGDDDSADVETPDADKLLICDALTPYAARDEFAGFYVSHQTDDPLVVEVRDVEVPRMLGMKQQFHEGLEAVNLVLNSETVSISGLGANADLATADGVAVDGPAGLVEIFAEKQVKLKQKITVEDEVSSFDQNLQIAGAVQIEGDTSIQGKVDIASETTIAKTLDVGG